MEDYQDEKNRIISNLGFHESEIFDIDVCPYVDDLSETFFFYKESLKAFEKAYSLDDVYFYFSNNTSLNAKASRKNRKNIISLNSGLMVWVIAKIKENTDIDEYIRSLYPILNKIDETSINRMMYEIIIHFSFYHELAHIIQLNEQDDSVSFEEGIADKFDLIQHKLEIDADEFSSLAIAHHLLKYILKYTKLDSSIVHLIVVLYSSSIFTYLLSFKTSEKEMYIYESTHPHPAIRILNIILTITQYVNLAMTSKKKEIRLNHEEVFRDALILTEQLNNEVYNESKLPDFKKHYTDYLSEINEYFPKIRETFPENYKSSKAEWNKNAR